MSLFILDTDIATLYQAGHEVVSRRILAHPMTEVAISIISVEEQFSGWYTMLRKAKTSANLAFAYESMTRAIESLSRLSVISFTEPAIDCYVTLLAMKLNIGKMDLRIAAIVLEHGAILVTRNTRDFIRVPGLSIENWADTP
jgi:tRNA(fMet)-specific endonuclease VapC